MPITSTTREADSTALTPSTQKELIHTVDWDLLIILDACRADFFERLNTIPGKFRKVTSAGSCTIEWVSQTFTEFYPDILYISSVPFVAFNYRPKVHGDFRPMDHFGLVRDLWMDKFDDHLQTVPPVEVVRAAQEIRQRAPNRRVVAHFIQPHPPMIGQPPFTLFDWNRVTHQSTDVFPSYEEIWKKGYAHWLRKAYEANLKLVLNYVERLVRDWKGKAVVTADHGEGFGEEGVYGHPQGVNVRALREVPWLELDKR